MFKKILFFIFSVKGIQNSKGFSIIGVLVAISMGILVTLALSSMLSSMNSDVTEIKKTANQIELTNQINTLLATDCQAILLNSITNNLNELNAGGAGTSKTDPIKFSVLKDGNNVDVLNTDTSDANNKQKIKKLYGIEGYSRFQLSCKSSRTNAVTTVHNRCKCDSGIKPCNADWLLSLFTMSYNKGYKEILKQNLRITYPNYNNDLKDFTCNFTTSSPVSTTSSTTFFGHNAGETGNDNAFFGYNAGNTTTEKHNSFFGSNTGGLNTTGKWNSFFGTVSGASHTTGEGNSFFGYETGRYLDGNILRNSFFGSGVLKIKDRKIGNKNSIFGYTSKVFKIKLNNVEQTISNNTLFGHYPCYKTNDNEKDLNLTSGSANHILCISRTIMGQGSKNDNDQYPSQQGIEIHGRLRQCNPTCQEVQLSLGSSREYKKNILPFNEEQKALSALVKTPLFTYQYKADYPNKKRTGIISEELPKALQLPAKVSEPAPPDWISIYGYLWAGIKALNKEILDLKNYVFKDLQSLESLFQKEWKFIKNIVKDLKKLKIKIKKLKKKIEIFEKENPLKIEIQESKQEEIEKEIKQLKKQAKLFQEELKEIKKQNKD